MKIVYFCWTGGHAATVAAAIQLEMLPVSRPPSPAEVMTLPYFDQLGRKDVGFFYPCGQDRWGNQVLVAGHGGGWPLVGRAARAAARLKGWDENEIVLVDCSTVVGAGWLTFGLIGQAIGGRKIRRRILAQVIVWHYGRLLQLVRVIEDRVPS